MRTVATLCRELAADRRNDGELLAAFISATTVGVSGEEAFSELIRRYGPLVWGTCRRLLPNPADAEDAFQAAFLVLVRRANKLTHTPTLGPWLHRVAVWTARNVKRKNARQFARQTELPEHVSDPAATPNTDWKFDLDSALLELPSRYRDSIILCHLQGYSRREAAERLGCAEGTLSAWLHRGLAKLRARLQAFDPKLLSVPVAVPTVLAMGTVRAATTSVVAIATIPPAVNSLVEGVLQMFWMKKASAAAVALLATFALGMGIGVSTNASVSASAGAGEGGSGSAKDSVSVSANAGEEKPTKPKTEPTADDRAKQLAELQREIAYLEEERHLLDDEAAAYEATVASLRGSAADIEKCSFLLERLRRSAEEATKQLQVAKDKLARLKDEAKSPNAKPNRDYRQDIALLEEEVLFYSQEMKEYDTSVKDTEHRLKTLREGNPASEQEKLAKSLKALQKTKLQADEVKKKLLAARDALAKLKGEEKPAKPEPPKNAPLASVADLERQWVLAERRFRLEVQRFEAIKALLRETAKAEGKNRDITKDPDYLQAQTDLERAKKELEGIVIKLEAAKADPQPVRDFPKEIAELERQIKMLELQKRSHEQAKRDAEEVDRKLKVAQDTLAKLKLDAAKQTRGYLDITISGKPNDYAFELKETDAAGKVTSTFTLRDTSDDAKLLTRLLVGTKADPNSPLLIRVIAQPQTSLGYGPRASLKACHAAGYKTVRFTGYVYAGGVARELGPDWTGPAAGYTRYDAADKDPGELLKEIEDGLRKQ